MRPFKEVILYLQVFAFLALFKSSEKQHNLDSFPQNVLSLSTFFLLLGEGELHSILITWWYNNTVMVFDERRHLLELNPFKWQLFVPSNISFIILCVEFTANKPEY